MSASAPSSSFDPPEATAAAENQEPQRGALAERNQDRYVGDVELTKWRTSLGRRLAVLARWLADTVGPYATLLLTLAIGAAVATAMSFFAVLVYDAVTDKNGIAGVDRPLLDAILAIRSPAADAAVTGFTDLAGTIGMPVVAVAALLALSIRRRSWTPVVLIVAAGVGSLLMTVAGKMLIGRDRPPLSDAVPPYELSASFPSGHTLNAVAILGVIAYLLILRRRSAIARVAIVAAAVVVSLLVAVSRVYLGHHWATDVIAGWALGAAWLALVITAHRMYLTSRLRHDEGDGVPPRGVTR